MGTGEAKGEDRALKAAEAAIHNPLLEEASLRGARAVLVNVTGGQDMTLLEVDEAANIVSERVDPEANIIFGAAYDRSIEGSIRVSVVAAGLPQADPAQSGASIT
jgi:cell division protein FtsZ